jgi:hypothetical protein
MQKDSNIPVSTIAKRLGLPLLTLHRHIPKASIPKARSENLDGRHP